jgi:phosphopantetheine adenylyltransferase
MIADTITNFLEKTKLFTDLRLFDPEKTIGHALCINFSSRLFYDEIIGVVYSPEEKCFASLARRDKDIYLVKYWTKDMRE